MLTHALLDKGSTVTLIDAELVDIVGARGPPCGLSIHGANRVCSSDSTSQCVKLSVHRDGDKYTITANTVIDLNLPTQVMASRRQVKPRLLIGQDNVHLLVSRKVREKTVAT